MSTHDFYVLAAYASTALGLAGLIAWVLVDQWYRRNELARLEASGVRRRSDRSAT